MQVKLLRLFLMLWAAVSIWRHSISVREAGVEKATIVSGNGIFMPWKTLSGNGSPNWIESVRHPSSIHTKKKPFSNYIMYELKKKKIQIVIKNCS